MRKRRTAFAPWDASADRGERGGRDTMRTPDVGGDPRPSALAAGNPRCAAAGGVGVARSSTTHLRPPSGGHPADIARPTRPVEPAPQPGPGTIGTCSRGGPCGLRSAVQPRPSACRSCSSRRERARAPCFPRAAGDRIWITELGLFRETCRHLRVRRTHRGHVPEEPSLKFLDGDAAQSITASADARVRQLSLESVAVVIVTIDDDNNAAVRPGHACVGPQPLLDLPEQVRLPLMHMHLERVTRDDAR